MTYLIPDYFCGIGTLIITEDRGTETGKVEILDKEIIDEMIGKFFVFQDKTIKIVYSCTDELDVI